MLYFTTGELITLLIVLPLAGAVFGYYVAGDRMRRVSGGKTPAELKQELETYQASVSGHFQHSAELLQQMTEQYREIYTHMARGAAELCDEGNTSAEVDALKRLSVALDDAAALPPAGAPDNEPGAGGADHEGDAAPATAAAAEPENDDDPQPGDGHVESDPAAAQKREAPGAVPPAGG